MKAIVILSGGLDSTTLLYWAKEQYEEVEALSFDYGQKHKKELEFAKWNCSHLNIKHKIIKLDFSCFNSSLLDSDKKIPEGHYEDESMKSTVVPFRNGIMLSYAVGYAENIKANSVLIGSHAGDYTIYPDCRESFIKSMSMASAEGTYNYVTILSPFNKLKKWEIINIGIKLKVPYGMTWTCYKGGKEPCNKCGSCKERIEAFNIYNNKIKGNE